VVEGEGGGRASLGAADGQPLADFRFQTTITVRFCEIDGNRHTNEVSYFVYMEHVRMLYLEHLGLFDELLDVSGEASLMAVNFACQFHAMSHFLQRLRAAARVVRLGRSSVDFEYAIAGGDDALVATGRQTLVYVDHTRNHSRPLPVEARRRIADFENLMIETA
jgi:acyl-CoA thioester hydrolase